MRFPPFDDDEPPLSYEQHIENIEPLDPINLPLDSQDDEYVKDWLYDSRPLEEDSKKVNGTSYKKWSFDLPEMSNLYRLSTPLRDEVTDKNYYYLFDKNLFLTVKPLITQSLEVLNLNLYTQEKRRKIITNSTL